MSGSTLERTLPISGMTCTSCASTIEKALNEVPGVAQANVNLATEKASVMAASPELETSDLITAVRDVGYDVPNETITLPIVGMTCASCITRIEGALSEVAGVVNVVVNLATEQATVNYIPGIAWLNDFKQAVDVIGYQVLDTVASIAEGGEDESLEERKIRNAQSPMLE